MKPAIKASSSRTATEPSFFICYRRTDTADVVGRIYEWIEEEFPATKIFRDIDSIPIGADFTRHVQDSLANCCAVLVIIGRDWLTVKQAGRRRIDHPRDYVRLEIEHALSRREIDVIPILVQGATMPAPADLPESLRPLAYRNAAHVRPDPDFKGDLKRLSRHLARTSRSYRGPRAYPLADKPMEPTPISPNPSPHWPIVLLSLLCVGLAIAVIILLMR